MYRNNYVVYHLHSDVSFLDSCTNFKDYVDRAVECGMKAICFTEHGNIINHIEKKLYCEEKGIKYLHGIELYLTRDSVGEENRTRDNFHTILIAKNEDGFKEINSLIEVSSRSDHRYYSDRITFDEFFALSDNVIKISACLASPLNKIPESDPIVFKLIKAYDFLEIQPHINSEEQKEYNKKLYRFSQKYGKPLIAGTDTHSLNSYKAECRDILLKYKGQSYGDEDTFDLTFKTREDLESMFTQQDSIPESAWMEAIDNTNALADMVTEHAIDKSFKYPKMYDDDTTIFRDRVYKMYRDKLEAGIIKEDKRYVENIEEELRVIEKIGMSSFMLFMSELLCWCRENRLFTTPCRGSVGGSQVAYLTDITDVDPVIHNTVFSRFANEDRIEIGDIDVDFYKDDRPKVFEYIINRFSEAKTAYILTTQTCVEKKTIEVIAKALGYSLEDVNKIKIEFGRDQEKTKKKYPKLFYYYDGVFGTQMSKGMHPAAIVISPITLSDNYGVMHSTNAEGEEVLVLDINMDEVHEVSLVKYDILGLKNVGVVMKACDLAGLDYPRAHEINWNVPEVWESLSNNNVGIFQFESPFAGECLKKFQPRSLHELCLLTAALRPSGESFRTPLIEKKRAKNPSEIIDKMLEGNYGYLVFQEDTIKFLKEVCGLSGGEADNIRRAIGRKDKERLDQALPAILDGYCGVSDKEREVATEEAKEFIQIIEDSSRYQFGYNHSVGYSMLGYICGYLRYFYPLEFCAALLQTAETQEDISDGTSLCRKLKITVNPIKFRKSRADYFIDRESRSIYKGIKSIKFLNEQTAEDLYAIRDEEFPTFMDFLRKNEREKILNSRQLEILIKLDFFSEFGNSKKLMEVVKCFNFFKASGGKGLKKSIAKDNVKTKILERVIKKNSRDTGKKYIFEDLGEILTSLEKFVMESNMEDFTKVEKIASQMEYLGYMSASGEEDDRRVLFVKKVYEARRKSDKKIFGYNIVTQSIGSGVESRWTIFKKVYDLDPVKEGDVIFCIDWSSSKGFFNLDKYRKIK